MSAVKNNLVIDMENLECDYDDYECSLDFIESMRLQRELSKNFFDRQLGHFVNLLRRLVCK